MAERPQSTPEVHEATPQNNAPQLDPQAIYEDHEEAYKRMSGSSEPYEWANLASELEYTENTIGDQLPNAEQAELKRMKAYAQYRSIELRYGPFEGDIMETKVAKNIKDKKPNQIYADKDRLVGALKVYQQAVEMFEASGLENTEECRKAKLGVEATQGMIDILDHFMLNRVSEEVRLQNDLPKILKRTLKFKKTDDVSIHVEKYASQIEITILHEDGRISELSVEPIIGNNGQIAIAEIKDSQGEFKSDINVTKTIIEMMEGKNPKYPRDTE